MQAGPVVVDAGGGDNAHAGMMSPSSGSAQEIRPKMPPGLVRIESRQVKPVPTAGLEMPRPRRLTLPTAPCSSTAVLLQSPSLLRPSAPATPTEIVHKVLADALDTSARTALGRYKVLPIGASRGLRGASLIPTNLYL